MGLKTFIDNIRYLSRYNLKQIHNEINSINKHIDYLPFAIYGSWDKIKVPSILNTISTINYIIDNKSSFARFGDGEFNIIKNGLRVAFQNFDKKLQTRLKEILVSEVPNLKIGIPYNMFNLNPDTYSVSSFNWKYYGENNSWIIKLLKLDELYLNASATCFSCKEEYELWKQVWNKRDITIICGDRVFNKIKNNIFASANSVEYLYAPTENAFEKYEEILESAKNIAKDRLIIAILGPTATVLVHDLAKLGYQALDLGHLAKSYDAFCSNIEMTQKNISEFFGKD